jgi:Nucleotidyltransferase domain
LVDDDVFPGYVAGRLAELPAVEAVNLGGSRARGTHRPDSDWDFGIYYRGHFQAQALRDVGWPGEVFEVGGWGGGVFNGGAWLEVDHRRVDVHYRDLDTIDRELAHAVLAARGEWVTNDKTLLTQAGLRQVDEFLAIAKPDPGLLRDAAERSRALCAEALRAATAADDTLSDPGNAHHLPFG